MAFSKKADVILKYNPDILIVPECEHPDKLVFDSDFVNPTNVLWFGTNQNKGLAIFSFNGFSLTLLESHNPQIKMIIPVSVTNAEIELTLFAVWANNPKDPDGAYVEQVWKALNHYDNLLNKPNTIFIGDFNSNTIWDKKNRISSHSNVLNRLESQGIFSSYHLFHNQIQGKEHHPTLYMYRHKNKPYHIDYCFMSKDLTDKIENVEIGDFEYWINYSDHVPLIVTINVG